MNCFVCDGELKNNICTQCSVYYICSRLYLCIDSVYQIYFLHKNDALKYSKGKRYPLSKDIYGGEQRRVSDFFIHNKHYSYYHRSNNTISFPDLEGDTDNVVLTFKKIFVHNQKMDKLINFI